MRRTSLALSVFVLAATACGVFGTDGESSSSSSGGGSSSGGKPPEETSKPPGVDGKPLEGIFVSQTKGNDATGDGSMAKPLATLAAGLAKGQKDRQRVLVCAETYNEQVTWLDGVSAYGYFDCQGPEWKLDETRRARVQSPKSPALKAEAINQPTRIEGFEIVAPDLGEGSPDEREPLQNSSIAAFVKGSSALTISKSTLKAGKGRDGVDGTNPPPLVRVDDRAPQIGVNETLCTASAACTVAHAGQAGGLGGQAHCDAAPPGVSQPGPGGAGGDGGHWDGGFGGTLLSAVGERTSPTPGLPTSATPGTAKGGALLPPLNGNVFIAGFNGDTGATGASGTDGVNGVAVLSESGFAPGDGTRGTSGAGGQGGGGGAGQTFRAGMDTHNQGASGGGGGAGGCPGLAGEPGLGGGASLGLLVVQSDLSLERVTITSSKGGRAGVGTLGSLSTDGQSGAAGGVPRPVGTACTDAGGNPVNCTGAVGGNGGAGGRAGVSGHGAAGPSLALVHFGAAPRMSADTVLTPGEGGDGAPRVQAGAAVIPESPKGASEKIVKAGQ